MSTRTILSRLPIALVALTLCRCTLDRSGIVEPSFVWETAATLLTAEGVAIRVTGDDDLFSGGAPRVFASGDSTFGDRTPEVRVREEWRRYLLARLSDPASSPEFRAVFGDGPWCLVEDEARRTDTPRTGPFTPPLTGDELMACGAVVPVTDCPTGPATLPMLAVDPPAVTFAPVPAGTTSPEEQTLTIANSGTGRLCLAPPALDLSESAHPEYYAIDATDCAPMSARELELGRAQLRAERPSCQVRIRFAPTSAEPGGARLRLNTNDPRPVTFVDISGTPLPGSLVAAPDRVCFNTPADGAGCRRNVVRLRNDGPGLVTVRSVSLPATAAGWTHEGVTLPARIAAGGMLSVPVRACGAPAADTLLTVASDATTRLLEVTLLRPGSGCAP